MGTCGRPHLTSAATVMMQFDTVSGNSTGGSDGGGNIQLGTTDYPDDSTLTLAETIVANGIVGTSPTTNCAVDAGAAITSGGYNLVDDSTCGTPAGTDIIGKNPQLGPLANNGGPTETLLPADASPEVGAIPDAVWVASGVGADQRGVARGAGANSSATIGAVEVGQNFNGYRMVANEGGIFDFGLLFSGSLANNHLNAPIVGIANSPGPAGYLMAGGDGGVFALGGANFFGSLGGQVLPSPIAAIAATPSEDGYWLIAQNGKIYHFGNTPDLAALSLPPGAHIVGMASTNTGKGIWVVDQYGDVYAEGDAQYVGGLGGVHINAPIVGIAPAAAGQGYVLVASDGGVFNYNMGFYGSVPGSLTGRPAPRGPDRGHRGHPLGQGLLGGGSRRRAVQLRRRPLLGLHLHRHPGQDAQRPDRRDPAPGGGQPGRLNDAGPAPGPGPGGATGRAALFGRPFMHDDKSSASGSQGGPVAAAQTAVPELRRRRPIAGARPADRAAVRADLGAPPGAAGRHRRVRPGRGVARRRVRLNGGVGDRAVRGQHVDRTAMGSLGGQPRVVALPGRGSGVGPVVPGPGGAPG